MSDNDDDEVGYKKPPKAHRFKPGNQMAKGGKGRRSPTIESLLQRKLNQQVKVTRDGRVVKISLVEALIERLVKLASTGTSRDVTAMLNLIKDMAPNALSRPEDQNLRVTYVLPPPNKDGYVPLAGPPDHLLPPEMRRRK